MNRQEAELRLKETFGIDHFYDEQWAAISRLLAGQRILMIERTGFGKSLCYQFPATTFPGMTIVFSPLIALMRDQVFALRNKGIAADYINSEHTREENLRIIDNALKGKIKILYIAPERQENDDWVKATQRMNISMVVVDEAHTISTWGHDFRPAFRRIINLVKLLPAHLPVLATTATATERVQHDIERQIGGEISTIRGSLVRHNLRLRVLRVSSEDEKLLWLAQNINKMPGTGLIYTGTRVDTEVYAKWLTFIGVNSIEYNAGLDEATRRDIEAGLKANKWKCVVSTNALGMGIDKADIRFILHTQMPASPIHYYQEIGRAGRDGQPSDIVLMYNDCIGTDGMPADYRLPRAFIDGARPPRAKYEKVIDLLKEEPLSERQIIKKANLKQPQVRIIKADLIDQKIITEVLVGKTKNYEYRYGAPQFKYDTFEQLRQLKLKDLDAMVEYVYTARPRMQYLCNFLDSDEQNTFNNCDNTTLDKPCVIHDEVIEEKLRQFRETFFPVLDVADTTSKTIEGGSLTVKYVAANSIGCYVNEDCLGKVDVNAPTVPANCPRGHVGDFERLIARHIEKKSRVLDGCAASYYGASSVGATLHRCKYESGGDFPDHLLRLTLKAYRRTYGSQPFDLVLYVPPTTSGDLVKNFAEKLASVIKVPISHSLIKVRDTVEQKMFQNNYGKQDNVKDAFDIDQQTVDGKRILLVDDIYDSGHTIKEIGRMLTLKGAAVIAPIVIAKTVGGTL